MRTSQESQEQEKGGKRKASTFERKDFVTEKNKYDCFPPFRMTQGQLHQRRRTTTAMSQQDTSSPVALSRPALLKASPQEHGLVQKLHVPLFYSILPRFMQKCISSTRMLGRCLGPRWEARYLVLLGSYLYKFEDDNSKRGAPSRPKGSPLALSSIEVYVVGDNDLRNLAIDRETLPFEDGTVFCVSTFRKQYYYCVSDHEQATVWVNSILEARQEAIKRSMGHAQKDSYPKAWEYYDHLGQNLKNQKERIRQRMERKELQELEMSQLSEGAPLSSGYFG